MKSKKGQEVWTGSEAQQREYAKNNPTKTTNKTRSKPAPKRSPSLAPMPVDKYKPIKKVMKKKK